MTKKQVTTRFKVAHMTFETKQCPRSGTTFGLYASPILEKKKPKPLFVGFIEKGMAAELLELSAHIRKLEKDLKDGS